MSTPIIWTSPLNSCDGCGQLFNHNGRNKVMYDAALPPGGPWGTICGDCFERGGCKLGVGLGQKYELKPYPGDPHALAWVLVEGDHE
jgi:hypothetical protein